MNLELDQAIIEILDLNNTTPYAILDVGCGKGALLNQLSLKIDKESRLLGTDALEKMCQSAQQTYKHLDFQQLKFDDHFKFPDNSFDVVVSVNMLECLLNKEAFVKETARILKPGGQILMAHWDFDTQVYNTNHKQTLRKVLQEFADWQQSWMDTSDGMMGRKQWGLFEGAQLEGGKLYKGKMDVFTLIETTFSEEQYGYQQMVGFENLVKNDLIKQSDFDLLFNEMKELYQKSQYLYSLNCYIYSGRKL